MNYTLYLEVLRAFNCGFKITESNELIWHGDNAPTDEEVNSAIQAEPMRLLREQRNQKLAETDWWCASDRTPTQAQLNYRTTLRNLPSTASPSLDENGNLTGVNWPEKPQN